MACYFASILLLIGCFTPLASIPAMGTITYLRDGRGDGLLVLGISIAVFYFGTQRKYQIIRKLGLLNASIISITYWDYQIKLAFATRSLNRSLEGNPFRGFADTALQSVKLEWAWFLLIIGSVLLLLVPKIKINEGQISLTLDDIFPSGEKKFDSVLIQAIFCGAIAIPIAAMLQLLN